MSMIHTLTIPTGQTVSNVLANTDLSQNFDCYAALTLVQCPPTLPSITSIGLEFSDDGVTYGILKDEYGISVAISVSAGSWVSVLPKTVCRVPKFMRLKSNVAASADRSFTLYFRKV